MKRRKRKPAVTVTIAGTDAEWLAVVREFARLAAEVDFRKGEVNHTLKTIVARQKTTP